jgi:hypothetical protein
MINFFVSRLWIFLKELVKPVRKNVPIKKNKADKKEMTRNKRVLLEGCHEHYLISYEINKSKALRIRLLSKASACACARTPARLEIVIGKGRAEAQAQARFLTARGLGPGMLF